MDSAVTREGASTGAELESHDSGFWQCGWKCEQWSEEAVDFCRRKLERDGVTHIQDGTKIESGVIVPQMIPIKHGITSEMLRKIVGDPENVEEAFGNLLLNEGIQRLQDMTMIATVTSNQVAGNPWSNTNAYIGVGDTATAEAATQTELQAAAAATNRFYKVMSATYPIRTNQSVDFRADFTTTEANFAWQEWTVAAGATTASGAGFLTGTINLNRKVQSLGTKATGTWTMTGTVTIS
jgi:hypothetical protein